MDSDTLARKTPNTDAFQTRMKTIPADIRKDTVKVIRKTQRLFVIIKERRDVSMNLPVAIIPAIVDSCVEKKSGGR